MSKKKKAYKKPQMTSDEVFQNPSMACIKEASNPGCIIPGQPTST